MRRLLPFLLCCVCSAQPRATDPMGKEIVTGSLHVVWVREDLHLVEPDNPELGLWANLHSDDPSTFAFDVTLRYEVAGRWVTTVRTIQNIPANGYWMSDPTQCIFWFVPPRTPAPYDASRWPQRIIYSISERKYTERDLVEDQALSTARGGNRLATNPYKSSRKRARNPN